jgi:Kinesin motor domain
MRVSYLEIYNERIRDLLTPDQKDLKLSVSRHRVVCVSQLKEEVVTSPNQLMEIISRGENNRSTFATINNEHSSRSHTIFQLTIESRTIPKDDEEEINVLQSQLNLIDLAGSEKATNDSDRQKEGAFINKSLLTLGNVIAKITQESGY